jgi:hypothetical protein
VPALILHAFPDWFAGVAFAAIGIGGLVPAAVMSIAASNLFTRNIYVQFVRPNCTPKQEAQNAKIASLIVKFGALIFIIFLPLQYAIQLQLLGGIWISQTIPAVIVGLYTRWLNPWALIIGWGSGSYRRYLDGCLAQFPVRRFPVSSRRLHRARLRGTLRPRDQFYGKYSALVPTQPDPSGSWYGPDVSGRLSLLIRLKSETEVSLSETQFGWQVRTIE